MRAIAFFLCCFAVAAAGAEVQETHYYDEVGLRHLRLKAAEFGSTEVEVRFAGDPGSSGKWQGIGQRKDKEMIFARVAGEGEDRGTFFVASITESKVEIQYKPGQKEPQDAGILGIYRRASEGKRGQLAKKEFQAANDRLVAALKAGAKTWTVKDRGALGVWKDQWPVMRQRWMDISYVAAPVAGASGAKAPAAPPLGTAVPEAEKGADYWFKLAEATARGYYFVETLPDPKTGLDWDGEYDDFSGGHVSLRTAKDGRLRMSLTFSRAEDTQTGQMDAVAAPDKITKTKDGEMVAEFAYSNADAVAGGNPEGTAPKVSAPNAAVRLTKMGRYLVVKTDGAGRYAGKAWFDGVYRGAPVPEP